MIDVSAIIGMVSKALAKVESKGALPEILCAEMPDGAVRVSLGYGESHPMRCQADSDAMSKLSPMGKKLAAMEQSDRMAFASSGLPVKEIAFGAQSPELKSMGADCHFLYR